MTKQNNNIQHGALRAKILTSASAVAIGALMLSSTAIAAEASATNDAPIATNSNAVLMAQVVEQPNRAGSLAAGEDKKIDEVVTTGIRSSLEAAIEVKRNADNILDGISAEGIGRFPDLNLAESLQRISGVQIIRDDFRNGTVAIRGLNGFSKTQVNGQDLAAPNFGGSFVYGIFESSVLGGVDVMKTPHVRMDTGGIAGVVNLKTRNALDFEDDRHLFVSVKAQYEGLNQAIMPDLGLSTGFKNAAGNFGAYVSVGYQEKDFRSDSFKITEYTAIDSNFIPDTFGNFPNFSNLNSGELAALNGDFSDVTFVPKRARYTSRETTGDRISIAGGAEWQASDDLHFNLTGIFAKSKSEQPLNTISLMTFGTRGFRFNILDTVDEGQFGRTATRISVESPQMQVQERIRDNDFQTYAMTLNGDWEKGPWNVHGAVHYTAGETQQSQHQVTSRIESRSSESGNRFLDNGLVAQLSFDPNDRYGFGFTTNRSFNDIGTFGWSTTNAIDPVTGVVNNRDNLFAGIFTGSTNNFDRSQDQIAVQLDVNREMNVSLIESVDFGVKFKSRSQSNRRKSFRQVFNNVGDNYYDLSALDDSFFGDSFLSDGSGYFGGRTSFSGLLVPDARAALAAVVVRPGALVDDGLTLDQIDPETGLVFNALGTGIYDVSKDTLAFYASANINEEIPTLGINLRGNFGFRYIDTSRLAETSAQNTIEAFPGFTDGRERVDVSGEANFNHFLPQVNLILDVTDNLVVRGSWSKNQLNDLSPTAVQAGSNITAKTGTSGRVVSRSSDQSQLLPNTATSFDFAVEWYNRAGSTVHGALFTKEINDSVIIDTICAEAASVPGIAQFISGTTRFDGLGNANGGRGDCIDDSGTIFKLTRRFNTDDSFRVSGAEFGFTQNFDFLEGFWANFGVTANYTYLKKHEPTRVTTARFDTTGAFVGNTNILDQLSLSPHSFNVIPYYETDTFGIRLAGNFRSHFNDGRSLGGFLGADRIVDDRMQWDLSGSYNFSDHLKLGAEIINIFDADRYEYQGVEGRFRNLFSEGRTMTMSLSYTY